MFDEKQKPQNIPEILHLQNDIWFVSSEHN